MNRTATFFPAVAKVVKLSGFTEDKAGLINLLRVTYHCIAIVKVTKVAGFMGSKA